MSDFFEDYKNIFNKTSPLREAEAYDSVVYNINRYISMDFTRAMQIADLTKYIWTLSGRYYYLLYRMFPKNSGKRITWIKKDEIENRFVELIEMEYQCSKRQAHRYLKIFQKMGIDLNRRYGGMDEKNNKAKRSK